MKIIKTQIIPSILLSIFLILIPLTLIRMNIPETNLVSYGLGMSATLIITEYYKRSNFKIESIKFLLKNLKTKGINLKIKSLKLFMNNEKYKIELYQKILEQYPNYNKKLQGNTTEKQIYELAIIIYFKNKIKMKIIKTQIIQSILAIAVFIPIILELTLINIPEINLIYYGFGISVTYIGIKYEKWSNFKIESIKFLLKNLKTKGINLKIKTFKLLMNNEKYKIELYQKILEQYSNYNKKLQGNTPEQQIYELAVIIYFENKIKTENITKKTSNKFTAKTITT